MGRWWRWRRPRQRDEELDEELQSHLEMAMRDHIEQGANEDAARAEARREFGNVELVKETARDAWGWRWVEDFFREIRFGIRTLRKSPGFTAVAVLTLALGVGANTAIFSVVDAVLLRPLPYSEPERLVQIWESNASKGSTRNVVNPANFLDWQQQSKSFESMAAIEGLPANLNVNGQPLAVDGLRVTVDFFSVLRAAPLLGRTFVADDGVPGHEPVVILSHALWQRQFGGSPEVVKQRIEVDGVQAAVIGVMPPGFSYARTKAEVWTPLQLVHEGEASQGRFLAVIGRLREDVTLQQARNDMARVADWTAQARPDFDKGWSAEVFPLLEDSTRDLRQPLWVLLAAVGFLLLIACANVANLTLMRGTGRLHEIAVRSALGASRSRIIQQQLAESLILAIAGLAAGIVFAEIGLRGMLALVPGNAPLPRGETIAIDGRVLLFAACVSVSTAMAFALIPALRVSRVDPKSVLQQGTPRSGVRGHEFLRRCFVVAEVALAVLLSVGAGLMLRSFARLIAVDPGFAHEHIVTMHIFTSPRQYDDGAKRSRYFDALLSEIRHTPGVEAAGSTHFLPLTGLTSGSCFALSDQPPVSPADAPSAQFLIVSDGYFRTMGMPLLNGRDFEERDNFSAPSVAVVNQAFARKYFAGGDGLGKHMNVCWSVHNPVEIVGILADARQTELQSPPQPTIYLSNLQAPMYFATFVMRAADDPSAIARAAEEAIHRIDPAQAVSDVRTMDAVFSTSVASPRMQAVLLLAFAGLAVTLAMIGVYGIVSYSVSKRTQEIGIRVAMGANSGNIARLVIGEAVGLSLIALIAGTAASLGLTQVMQALLYDIKPTDLLTLLSVGGVVLAVSIVAALLPMRRALRIDPMTALRWE